MKKLFQSLGLLLALLPVGHAFAIRVNDLYSATVPVADYSDAERDRALRRGLGRVLVKKTGDSNILDHPAVPPLLAGAASYVVEFGYTELPAEEGEKETPAVTARYARAEVDRFLRHNQLPIWPASRPGLLVWLVHENGDGKREFVESETDAGGFELLKHHFERRAVPYRLPLLDLEDSMLLSANQAWRFEAEAVASAAGRYRSNAWLVIRYYRASGGQWRGAWFLGHDSRTELEGTTGASLDDLLARSVDGAVDALASTLVYLPRATSDTLTLSVDGIASYRDFNSLMVFLAELTMVRDVQVERVFQRNIRLNLTVEGERELLLDNLAGDDRLVLLAGAGPESPIQRLKWLAGDKQ